MMRGPAFLVLLALSLPAAGGTLVVEVRDPSGGAVSNAVVYAASEDRLSVGAKRNPIAHAIMDQKNRMFVPHILPIQAGTTVSFPNSDDIRHQVYSFSPAKIFQLPLYKGTPGTPIVFDRPGIVALGCNIHDRMSAYIVVVDTPHFGMTRKNGRLELTNLPAGRYLVYVWTPEMPDEPPAISVTLGATERKTIPFAIRPSS
jgi:plastocyanin